MRLSAVAYLGGEYSVADIATWPWIRAGTTLGITHLDEFPDVSRWFKEIETRPAVIAALKKTDEAAKGAPAVCIPKFD